MKFFRKYFFYLIAVSFLTLPLTSAAQDQEAIEKELTEFLKAFGKDYVNVPTTKNTESVLKYFARDAKSNLFIFGISGRARVQNSDRDGFEAFLKTIIRSSGIQLGYDIGDIHFTNTSEEIATLAYAVNYEIKEDDGIWVKGNETVTMALEKRKEGWKIVHYTILQIEDEKLKGSCLCELFTAEGPEAEVVTKTTIPSGQSYSTKFDNFEFRKSGEDQVVRVGEQTFKRMKSGEVLHLGEEEETSLGVSSSKRETVLTILRDHLYKDSCASLRTKGG
ncbi:MAG: nuclear transport factor 2 family protein [Bacteroidota bacterium]